MNNKEIIYNKYRDIETLKKRLRDKNVEIDAYADTILNYISYSNLIKGFRNTKLVDEKGQFLERVSCKNILDLFILDKNFSNLIFKYILYVETFLNSNISRIVALNFGSHSSENEKDINNSLDYLYTNNYSNLPEKIKTLKNLKNRIKYPLKDTSMSYYKNNKQYYPPWVLFNSIYLSDTISFIKILKPENKVDLINRILTDSNISNEEKIDIFFKILRCIKNYRNHLAHPSMIIKKRIKSSEFLPFCKIKEYTDNKLIINDLDNKYKESVIYSLIICLSIIINSNPLLKYEFINDLHLLLIKNENFKFMKYDLYEVLNIPKNLINSIGFYFNFYN